MLPAQTVSQPERSHGCFAVAGCYSHLLYGYHLTPGEDGEIEAEQTFIYKAHSACIRTLCSDDLMLLSGSDDESIKIYNLRRKQEMGSLLQHNGSVGGVQFVPNGKERSTWMISSGEDGKLILWRMKDWASLLEIPAHNPSPNLHYSPLFSVHPSSRLCLSIGSQCELKMWDLTNGKCAYRKKLQLTTRSSPWLFQGQKNEKGRELPIRLTWSPSGSSYAILYPSHLVIIDAEDDEVTAQLEDEQLLMEIAYLNDDTIAIAGDAGTISVFAIKAKERILTLTNAHKLRIKGLSVIPAKVLDVSATKDALPFLVSASSDGDIKVWNTEVLRKSKKEHKPACIIHTDDRITAFCASVTNAQVTGGKRKREEEEPEPEEQEESSAADSQPKQPSRKKQRKPKVKITFE